MLFRTTLAARIRLGKRSIRKGISKQTLSTNKIKYDQTLLVIDLDYLELLLLSRFNSKQSSVYLKSNSILSKLAERWICDICNRVLPHKLLYISNNKHNFLCNFFTSVNYVKANDLLYSLLINHIKYNIVFTSNNMSTWAISNNISNIMYCAIDTNNRLVLYDNKTALDFFSRFILTYKAINKLRLNILKHMNLQYLFTILLYIDITNKTTSEFYFDAKYFKKLKKYNKPFSKSNGIGLELVSEAHKFLSYIFLTKPEFMDYFFMGSCDTFLFQLKRLKKIISFDETILIQLKKYYDQHYAAKIIKLNTLLYTDLPKCMSFHNHIIKNTIPIFKKHSEKKHFFKILMLYHKKYNTDLSAYATMLPLKRTVNKPEVITNSTDITSIDMYVSSLLGELNGIR